MNDPFKKSTSADPKDLQEPGTNDRVVQLEQQAAEYLDGWKRAKADYLNLQKSVSKEREQLSQFANESLVTQLLPLMDYFFYAFREIPEGGKDTAWVKGIQHIAAEFWKILHENGVEEIETVGKSFDPQKHESVEAVKESGQKSGMIVEEVSKGFTLHGKTLRPARVKVAQ